MIRKARKFGHRDPLVWSGELRRQAMMYQDVRTTSRGASVVIHGPRYLYQYRKNSNDPRKAQELAMISIKDAEACGKVMDTAIHELTDSIQSNYYDVTSGTMAA
jgi:hypothetical protein